MLTEGRNPPSQRVSECRRARERGGVQSGLRSSSLPSWCLSFYGNVYVGAGDKGPLSPSSPLFTQVPRRVILGSWSSLGSELAPRARGSLTRQPRASIPRRWSSRTSPYRAPRRLLPCEPSRRLRASRSRSAPRPRPGTRPTQLLDQLRPVAVGQALVDHSHVNASVQAPPPERLPGLGERPRFGHHLEVGLAVEHEGEDLPEGGVVLHKHNPELFGLAHVSHLPRSLAIVPSMLPSAEDRRIRHIRHKAYSPECVEGGFSELRPNGVLRSSAKGGPQSSQKLVQE